jgi:hypothetical protein
LTLSEIINKVYNVEVILTSFQIFLHINLLIVIIIIRVLKHNSMFFFFVYFNDFIIWRMIKIQSRLSRNCANSLCWINLRTTMLIFIIYIPHVVHVYNTNFYCHISFIHGLNGLSGLPQHCILCLLFPIVSNKPKSETYSQIVNETNVWI